MDTSPIVYKASGMLGDFILQLSVIAENYYKTGRKGILYISNEEPFRFGLQRAYEDTLQVVKEQIYIDEYKIWNNEPYNIDLSSWRHSPLLYKENWRDIFESTYNINWGMHPWIDIPKIDKWTNNVIISAPSYRKMKFNVNCVEISKEYGKDLIFVSFNKNDHISFEEHTGVKTIYYSPSSLYEFIQIAASCKLFIGELSAPLTFAFACHTPSIVPNIDMNAIDGGNYKHNYNLNTIWKHIFYSFDEYKKSYMPTKVITTEKKPICFIFRGEILRAHRPPVLEEAFSNWVATIFKFFDKSKINIVFITYDCHVAVVEELGRLLEATEIIMNKKISQLQNMNDVGEYMKKNKEKYSRFIIMRFDVLYRYEIHSWNKWNQEGIIIVSPDIHYYDEKYVADLLFIVDSYAVEPFVKALNLCKYLPHEVGVYLTTNFIPFHLMYNDFFSNNTHPLYILNKIGDELNLYTHYSGVPDPEGLRKCNPIYYSFLDRYGPNFQEYNCIIYISSKNCFYAKLPELNWLKTIFPNIYFVSTFNDDIANIYKMPHFHFESINDTKAIYITLINFSLQSTSIRDKFYFEPIHYKVSSENLTEQLSAVSSTFYKTGRHAIIYFQDNTYVKDYKIWKGEICDIDLTNINPRTV